MNIAQKVIATLKGSFSTSFDANGCPVVQAKTGGTGAPVQAWKDLLGTTQLASVSDIGTMTAGNFSTGGLGGYTNIYSSFNADVSFRRVAAGIMAMGAGAASGVAWLQRNAEVARVTADITNATATMANITDLAFPAVAIAGRRYTGEYSIFAADATGADGLAFDLNGGTATFTDLEFGFSATPAGGTLGTPTSTVPGTKISLTAVPTTDAVYNITFGFTCNVGGSVILRYAKNTGSTGNVTIRKNSGLVIRDSPN